MSYFGKRRREIDPEYTTCECCYDACHFDDMLACGSCENVLCSDCLGMECDICKDRERRTGSPNDVGTANICETCMAFPGCDACGDDVTICESCIADHLKTCSKKSRSQRIVSSAAHEISECEGKILKLRGEIESRQSQVMQLEADLAASRARKSAAENGMKQESTT